MFGYYKRKQDEILSPLYGMVGHLFFKQNTWVERGKDGHHLTAVAFLHIILIFWIANI